MIYAINMSSIGSDVRFVIEHEMKDGSTISKTEGMIDYSDIIASNIYIAVKNDYKRLFFYTTETGIIEAIAKRFRSGDTHLKNGLTLHKLLVNHRLVVANRPYDQTNPSIVDNGIQLKTIPSKPSERVDSEKRTPMHIAIFITDAEADAKVSINNSKNCSEAYEILEPGEKFRVHVFLIRWAGWKFMNYRAAFKIKLYPNDSEKTTTTYYEFGWISDANDGYAKDCLVKLSDAEKEQFDQYEKDLAEKQAKSEDRKKMNASIRPYEKKSKYQRSAGDSSRPYKPGGYQKSNQNSNYRGNSSGGNRNYNSQRTNGNNGGSYRGGNRSNSYSSRNTNYKGNGKYQGNSGRSAYSNSKYGASSRKSD